MKPALIIPVFNRPNYLRKCLESLSGSYFPDNIIVIMINDASTDPETIKLFRDFELHIGIVKFTHHKNQGIKKNIQFGVERAIGFGCDTFIILDSDATVKPDWIEKLLTSFNKFHRPVTGFNSIVRNKDGSERHPIIISSNSHHIKSSVGGINLVFNEQHYRDYFLPTLNNNLNWDAEFCKLAKEILCLTPSVVQHIGFDSSMNHDEEPDVAADYCNLYLPDVTLIGADTNHFEELQSAARISQSDIMFGDVKLLQPAYIMNAESYNFYCFKRFNEHVNTSHCLVIQHDGYVLNYKAWNNEWLQYDYIGATWLFKDNMNTGNGGFSLRSKRLLNALANDSTLTETMPEDFHICRTYRPYLEKTYGIKFAPEEVANRFSIEAYGSQVLPGANKYSGQFGFHGYNVDYTGSNLAHIPVRKIAKPFQGNDNKPWKNQSRRSHII